MDIKIITSDRKCYTRLTIGSEEEGTENKMTILIDNKKLVSFKYYLLNHGPIRDNIEAFSHIETPIKRKRLIRILKYKFYYRKEKTDHIIIDEFIKYIDNI